jgi:hypothetical protein
MGPQHLRPGALPAAAVLLGCPRRAKIIGIRLVNYVTDYPPPGRRRLRPRGGGVPPTLPHLAEGTRPDVSRDYRRRRHAPHPVRSAASRDSCRVV